MLNTYSNVIRNFTQSAMTSPATSSVPGVFKSLPSILSFLEKHRDKKEVDELLQLCAHEASKTTLMSNESIHPLIVFEGLDGSGKSLLTKITAKQLNGVKVSTPPEVVKPLRAYFDGAGVDKVLRRAFYSMGNYIAANRMLEILKDSPVIVDRFWHSTAAYAIAELENPIDLHSDVFSWPSDLLKPQLAIFLTVSESVRLERMSRRANFSAEEDQLRESASYRNLLTDTFKKMHSPSLHFISCDGPPKEVVADALALLHRKEKN